MKKINHINAATKALYCYHCRLKVYFSLHVNYMDHCIGLQKSCIYLNVSDSFTKELYCLQINSIFAIYVKYIVQKKIIVLGNSLIETMYLSKTFLRQAFPSLKCYNNLL